MKATPIDSLPDWAADILSTLPALSGRVDAARTLGVGLRTLDRRIRSGQLQVVKHGGKIQIPRLAIVRMLMAGATPQAA